MATSLAESDSLLAIAQIEPDDEPDFGAGIEIYAIARECRDLFEIYLGSSQERLHQRPMSQLQRRFLNWAGFLGVFAPIEASLDARLADSPEVKALFMSMLRVLKKNLKRGIRRHEYIDHRDEDRSPGLSVEEDGAMVGITGAMDRLNRLASILRTVSRPKHDEVQRVLQSRLERGPDGFDEVIFALIRYSFKDAAPSLQMQLASSIIYRRNRLMYQIRHEAKLQTERENPDIQYSDTAPTIPHHGPDALNLEIMENILEEDEMMIGQAMRSPTHNPDMNILLQGKNMNMPVTAEKQSEFKQKEFGGPSSVTSSSYSNNPFLQATYPAPPTVPRGQTHAICHLCCKPQARVLLIDKRRWRSHVNGDLRPYVCISEACGNITPAFSKRKEWINHMQTAHFNHWVRYIHRPSRWFCFVEDGEACTKQEFATQDQLVQHIKSSHPSNDMPTSQLGLLASQSKDTIPRKVGICPLCGKDELSIQRISDKSPQSQDRGFALIKETDTPSTSIKCAVAEGASDSTDAMQTLRLDTSSLEQEFTPASNGRTAEDIIMTKHISHHLESLALWSLRWWNDDSGAPDDISMIPSVATKQLDIQESFFSVPFERNTKLVGREQLVADLIARISRPSSLPSSASALPDETFNECQRINLHGPSGIGKTQIALEAVYRLHKSSPQCAVFWVSAETRSTFTNGFRHIAWLLRLPSADDPVCDALELVKEALSQATAGEWVLVVDNVGSLFDPFSTTDGTHLLPSSPSGAILSITMKSPVPMDHILVGPMTQMESRQLILQHGPDDNHEDSSHDNTSSVNVSISNAAATYMDYLLSIVRGNPRAIKQLCAYITRTRLSSEQYANLIPTSLSLYEGLVGKLQEYFQWLTWTNISKQIIYNSILSVQEIARESTTAQRYHEYLCFFGNTYIPRTLIQKRELKAALAATTDTAHDNITIPSEDTTAITILKAFGFVDEHIDGIYLSANSYNSAFMGKWLELVDRKSEVFFGALKHISEVFPDPKFNDMKLWEGYMPHAAAIISQYPEESNAIEPAVIAAYCELLLKMAKCEDITGKLLEAEDKHWKALRLKEQTLGNVTPSKLENLDHLGSNLFRQEKLGLAEEIHVEELALKRQVFGEKHSATLQTLNNLGVILHKQGKYGEAKNIYRDVFNLRLEVRGRAHPETMNSLKNLGLAQWHHGNLEESEKSYRAVIQVMEEETPLASQVVLEKFHIMESLSAIIRQQNRLEESEMLQRRVLDLKQTALGPDDPDTLASLNDLACICFERAKLDEAEEVHRDALQRRRRVLGSGHKDTVQSMDNLALNLQHQRKFDEAQRLYQDAMDIKLANFPLEHPSLRMSTTEPAQSFGSEFAGQTSSSTCTCGGIG